MRFLYSRVVPHTIISNYPPCGGAITCTRRDLQLRYTMATNSNNNNACSAAAARPNWTNSFGIAGTQRLPNEVMTDGRGSEKKNNGLKRTRPDINNRIVKTVRNVFLITIKIHEACG